jgi:hypothetical protein
MDLVHFKRWLNRNQDLEKIIEDWFWPSLWKTIKINELDHFGYEIQDPNL